VPLFADAAALLAQIQERHGSYLLYAEAWDPDELAKVVAPLDAEEGEEVFDPYDLRREEMRSALPTFDPFLAAVAAALERPAVQYPVDWYPPGDEAFRLMTHMLPFRARLMPERAAESADLLLRLAIRWRARDLGELINRHKVFREALRIVRDILARDPGQLTPYVGTWREWLAAEDPLAEFRFQCTAKIRSAMDSVEAVRRGEDPLAGVRKTFGKVVSFPGAWNFRWYARPIFYWSMNTAIDHWTDAIDSVRTDAGLREFLDRPDLDRFDRIDGVLALERIALGRLARVAFAVAAGETPPELDDPFTGRPLAVRRDLGVTVVSATFPERFRDRMTAPELFSWEVRR
jgi:hypothetical protein